MFMLKCKYKKDKANFYKQFCLVRFNSYNRHKFINGFQKLNNYKLKILTNLFFRNYAAISNQTNESNQFYFIINRGPESKTLFICDMIIITFLTCFNYK